MVQNPSGIIVESSIQVNTKITKTWKTYDNKEIISTHPPLEQIKIPISKDIEIEATLFKINQEKKEFQKMHEQLNYTN